MTTIHHGDAPLAMNTGKIRTVKLGGRGHDWYTGREKAARVFGADVARLVSRARAIGMETAMERLESGGKANG